MNFNWQAIHSHMTLYTTNWFQYLPLLLNLHSTLDDRSIKNSSKTTSSTALHLNYSNLKILKLFWLRICICLKKVCQILKWMMSSRLLVSGQSTITQLQTDDLIWKQHKLLFLSLVTKLRFWYKNSPIISLNITEQQALTFPLMEMASFRCHASWSSFQNCSNISWHISQI